MSARERFLQLAERLNQRVVGQPHLVNRLLVALLADGHLLVEGAPGLAKTRAVKELATAVAAEFHRVQFTPDLLPADLTGTEIFRPQSGEFVFQPGPLFHNIVLADEINRAPAKVQSALLEAMAERQITVGQVTYPLPGLFMVMATQNPIEQEGTYPLPEAQLDRFIMQVNIAYPPRAVEAEILRLARAEARSAGKGEPPVALVSQEEIFQARREVLEVYLAPALEEYLLTVVTATRDPAPFGRELAALVRFGASPRGSIALDRCARAQAWLAGREFVTPGDIQGLVGDILRHRVLLTYEAEADGVTRERFLTELLARVAVP